MSRQSRNRSGQTQREFLRMTRTTGVPVEKPKASPPPTPERPVYRSGSSHVRSDGTPKVSIESADDARTLADWSEQTSGLRFNVYLCDQRPEHYHVGRAKETK